MPSGQAPPPAPYREHSPPPALQPHFQCLWSSTVAPDYAGGFLVVPDGCVDIVCKGGRLLAVGPDRVAARPALVPGSEVWGARFGPGAASAWLGLPMAEIVGQAVELGDLLGPRAREWLHRINDAQPGAGQAVFIHGLVQMGRDAPEPDRQAMQLFGVAAAAGRDESGVLAAMRAQLDMSERSLRRLCHAQFGYGPKTLERVLRFQRLLALARSDRQAGLAALAAEAGYADQAHLSREVRALCGITPRAALQQLLV
ncbi:helix-turn-helix domain-containing protein [uncultured Delftia sp.]|jgi:AraC-like DNA-binding protein|nr:helix-turn-helix domain-containing protein [uncultured Delftia sp.]